MSWSGIRRKHMGQFQIMLIISYCIITLIPIVSALLIFEFHLYNQTKDNYENILEQFSNRSNIIVDDFFSNISRNTFFYITNTTLTKIIDKPYVQNELEYYEDHTSMRKAMDQIVLMNGSIAGITLSAFNGTAYSSTAANDSNMDRLLQGVSKSELVKGKVVVTNPYTESDNPNKLLSIIRYLTDLDTSGKKEGLVKVDINFQTIENMLGGISGSFEEKIGTFIVADQDVIHLSRIDTLQYQDILSIIPLLEQEETQDNNFTLMKMNNKGNFLLYISRIKSTNWIMVHFIPEAIIEEAFQKSVLQYVPVSIITLIVAFLLAIIFSKYFFKPINRVRKAMKLVDSGTLEHIVDDESRNDELGQLVRSYNAMIHRLVKSRETENNANQLQRKAEINMLQSQINPHFLYNTLNVIQSISELHRIEDISNITKSLASLYRYNLKSKEIVTIENELEQIKNYISIQQIRFVDKVKVIYEIDEEILQCQILKFLIQPIVENSFFHGLERKDGHGTLTLTIKKDRQSILICVADDGVGMNEQEVIELNSSLRDWKNSEDVDGTRYIGLRNVCSRIKYVYGDEYWINVSSRPNEGTSVEIKLPVETETIDYEYIDRR